MATVGGFKFDWASAGAVGVNLAGGVASAFTALGQRAVQEANADAQNIVRGANNELRAANFSLAQTMRIINNQRIARAASEQADAVTTTGIRAQNAFQAGRIDAGLRETEQLGAQAAQAAAAGFGGGSADAVRATLQLRAARLQEASEKAGANQQYDLIRQRAGILERGIQSQDLRPGSPGLDLSRNFGPGGSPFSTVSSLLSGLVDTDAKRATLNTFLGSIQRTPPAATGPAPGTLGSGTFDTGDDFYSYPGSTLSINPV